MCLFTSTDQKRYVVYSSDPSRAKYIRVSGEAAIIFQMDFEEAGQSVSSSHGPSSFHLSAQGHAHKPTRLLRFSTAPFLHQTSASDVGYSKNRKVFPNVRGVEVDFIDPLRQNFVVQTVHSL